MYHQCKILEILLSWAIKVCMLEPKLLVKLWRWNFGHPFSTKNLQVAARCLENFWTPVIHHYQSPLELS